VLIHDEEFTELLADSSTIPRIRAWVEAQPGDGTAGDGSAGDGTPSLEQLLADESREDLDPPGRHGRVVILTSGTTGAPKGAPRNEAGIDAAVSLLSRMPLKQGWRTHIA